ncbi:hypothetical protein [Sulfurisphaera javensis]|uniref:hypothetical protein n=1 Tax=Sulfurisphaera javensis TaxID=2049879 RepID=UPI0034E867A5
MEYLRFTRTGSSTSWTGIYILSPEKLEGEIGVPIDYILKNISTYAKKLELTFTILLFTISMRYK